MTTVSRPDPTHQQGEEHRSSVARASLVAGTGFGTTAIGGVLTAASFGGVDNPVALAALAAVCLIAGLTMLTAAVIMRGRR